MADYESAAARCVDDMRSYAPVFTTQLWRALGKVKEGAAAHEMAEKALAARPEERHVHVLTQGTHHRNALWLSRQGAKISQAEVAAAKTFFADHAARGFACFAADAQSAHAS